jgi:threonylcarbamoyladenosine tRNA methylthiotransferase MtaB
MKKVAFHTLGCKLNFSETSAIGRQFSDAGFDRVEFENAADVYVINTCSVTENADKKCRYAIRRALSQNPDAYIVVTGCYAQLQPGEIATIPGVDLVLGAKDKFRAVELGGDFRKESHACVHHGRIDEVDAFVHAFSVGDRTRSFLKIQDGCDYKCSFCTIPKARGKSRSDSLENVLRNARSIVEQGVKEIVLTGVNLGDYGQDQPHDFLDVVKALDEVDGLERVRISSIEPNLLSDEIIRFVARSKRFMPHFHIPLQSGSNTILAAMRRRYKRELYASRVALIREVMPHACIGVDVIVGFPGETEAHFRETAAFLADLDISYLHVFTYSERPDTLAADMEGSVPMNIRHQRNEVLRNLSERKRQDFYRRFEGQTRPALFEAADHDGWLEGFTDNYVKVRVPQSSGWANQIVPVKLENLGGQAYELAAKAVVQPC